jgi:hypothetical protein
LLGQYIKKNPSEGKNKRFAGFIFGVARFGSWLGFFPSLSLFLSYLYILFLISLNK